MDDILIFGKDRAQDDDRLRQTLDRLGRAGVTLNKDKCCFGVTAISFLGFQLSHEGIKPDPEKVRAIKELKTPESFGLGAVLLQIHPNKERRPVAFASRSLTPAESRYAQIEKEALVLAWAAERFEGYITGLDVVFETDHKPLVTLLGKSPIDLLGSFSRSFRYLR